MDLHNSYNLAALLSRLDIIAPYPTYKFLNEKHTATKKMAFYIEKLNNSFDSKVSPLPFFWITSVQIQTWPRATQQASFLFSLQFFFFFFISLYSFCFFTKNQNQNNKIEIVNNINKHHCMFTAMAKAYGSVIGQIITHKKKKEQK